MRPRDPSRKRAPYMTETEISITRDMTRDGKTIHEISEITGVGVSAIKHCRSKLRRQGIISPNPSGRRGTPRALKIREEIWREDYAPKGDHKGFLAALTDAYQKPVAAPPKDAVLHQISPAPTTSGCGSSMALCVRN